MAAIDDWKQLALYDGALGGWACQDASLPLQPFTSGTAYPLSSSNTSGTFLQDPGPGPITYAVRSSGSPTEFSNTSFPAVTSFTSFSMEVWVKVPSTTTNGPTIQWCRTVGPGMGFGNTTWDTAGRNLVLVKQGLAWVPTGVSVDANWHHIVVTVSGTTWTAYIDGSQAWTSSVSAGSGQGGEIHFVGEPQFSRYLAQSISAAAVYNAPLSAATVLNHYNASAGNSFTPPPVANQQVGGLGLNVDMSLQPGPTPLTLTTSQSHSVSLTSLVIGANRLTVTTTQAQALGLRRSVTLARAASQSHLARVSVQRAYVRVITQSQTVALLSGRTFVRVLSATQAQALTLPSKVSALRRAITQAQQVGLRGGSSRTLAITQAQAVALGRAVRLSRLVTAVQSVSQLLGRGYQRTVALTQAQAVSRSRTYTALLTITGSRRVTTRVSLGRVVGRVLRASSTTQPRLLRQIRLTRAVTQGQSAHLVGLPVQLRVVSVVQTRSLALGRVISLMRAITQPTWAWMPQALGLAPTIQQATLVRRTQYVRLTRGLSQPTAASVLVQNVTPRIFITVTASVSQQVALSSAGAGRTAKQFVVDTRRVEFVVGQRSSGFAVARRGVRFTVEER